MTQMYADEEIINALSRKINGCAFTVLNTLGAGFVAKVYENALTQEVQEIGLSVSQEQAVKVFYNGGVVGTYVTDLIVEQTVIVELKAAKAIDPTHQAQCLNYLKAAGLPIGLALNFGNARLEIKRVANGQ